MYAIRSYYVGLVAGVYIDRWDRKRTMITADSFIAFCTLLLAVLFFLNLAEIWHIYVLLALRSVGSAFHMPAMQASIPLLAPADQLGRIAGINQMLESVCNIAGPALGALFIGLMDISYILLLDVGGALMACLSLLFVRIPNPEQDENKRTGIWIELNRITSYNVCYTKLLRKTIIETKRMVHYYPHTTTSMCTTTLRG